MPNPFSTVFLPSVAGSAGAAGTGALAGMAEAPFAAYGLEEKRLLNELLKWQIQQAKLPVPFHFGQGSVFGTFDPATGKMSPVGQVPLQPRPLAPETAARDTALTRKYEAETKSYETGGGLRPTSRIDELIARKEATGIPLTPFEQNYKANKLKEKQQLAEILSGVRQREKAAAPPSFTERKYMAGVDALSNAQKQAMTLFNPAWVGPIAGRLTSAQLKTGFGLDPGQAQFVANYSSVKNRFIHELYGSALTAGEIERAIQQFPELTDPPEVFLEKMLVTEQYIKDMKKAGAKKQEAAGKVSAEQRFQELLDEGKNEDDAYDALVQEGY